jgi:hypothetical protein
MDNLSKLPANSRVWIYTADRTLTESEVSEIQMKLDAFTQSWTAHDVQLQAGTSILWNQVVLIAVNEAFHGISGCGIDKSVKVMKDLGEAYQINFFNRFLALVKSGESLLTFNKNDLQQAIDKGEVDEDSLVLNSLVQTFGQFAENNFISIHSFWMAPQLNFSVEK